MKELYHKHKQKTKEVLIILFIYYALFSLFNFNFNPIKWHCFLQFICLTGLATTLSIYNT